MIKFIKKIFGLSKLEGPFIYKVDCIKIYPEKREDGVFARQYNFFVIARSRVQARKIAHTTLDPHQDRFGFILGIVELNPSNIYEAGYFDIHENICIETDFQSYLHT